MKSVSRHTNFIVMVSVLAALLLTSTTPALAGSNGQQISIYACETNRITIEGYNQNGEWRTKTLDKIRSSCWYDLPGWWWKGIVYVYAYYHLTSEYPYYLGQIVQVNVPTSQNNSDWVYVTVPAPTARKWIQWRAWTWVNDKVPYVYGGGKRDGYKQDCSGYVSFAWQTPAPGFGTSQWDDYAYEISFDNLQPGDALVNPEPGKNGHMILFMGWVDKNAGKFIGYEENGYYGYTRESTFTVNKSTGKVSEGTYNAPGTYKAIRRDGL